MHPKREDKGTTDRFPYPLSAKDAKYIRTQEQKSNKKYAARKAELQRALLITNQTLEANHHQRQPDAQTTRKGNEDVIFISQNVRSLGFGTWPQNKEIVKNWFNAWKQELTHHGLTAIAIQETRLNDKTMVPALESMWCRMWGLKPNPQQPWTFWSIGQASKGVAILVNPRNKQNWIPTEVPAPPTVSTTMPTIDQVRCIVVQIGPWRLHNVYAPNRKEARNLFFAQLRFDTRWAKDSSILLGDMNCVDNGAIDRQDPTANAAECEELETLLAYIENEDAIWVGRNVPRSPVDTQDFQTEHMTCYPMHSRFGSRIDRIYVPSDKTSWVRKLTTRAPCVSSDHKQITLVLQPPTAVPSKRNVKLYAGNTEDFMAAQPLLSHLFKELAWQDMKGATVTKNWEKLKWEIRSRLKDLKRIQGTTRKLKKAAFLHRLGKMVQHTSGASKLQLEIRENLRTTHDQIQRKKGESIEAGIKCDAKFFKKISTKWTDPTIKEIDPPPGTLPGSLHANMTAWWQPIFTASYKQQRRGQQYQARTNAEWLTGIADRLPQQEATKLSEPVTLQEVRRVIRNMARNKATGPDGIPMDLYKDFAEEVAPILQIVTQKILEGSPLSSSMRQANIIPLKKKGNSTSGLDYRPIMLLNADYKIITGVITERLKPMMHWVIQEPQFGFVPGENMMDAIDLAQTTLGMAKELNLGADHSPVLVLLDFAKAYDSLNRLFLFNTMKTMGFPPQFMKVIHNLHTNTTARFLINGTVGPSFKISRGIRQGDPLAPFLFLFAIEVLLTRLNQTELGQQYVMSDATGQKVHDSTITAWGMVDDTVVQLQRGHQLDQVLPLLETFGALSGLLLQKTKSIAISLDTGMKDTHLRGIPLLQPGETTRYLGIQIGHGDIINPNWDRALATTKSKMGMAAKVALTPIFRAKALQAIVEAKFRALAPHILPSARIVQQWQNLIDNFFWEGTLSILGTGARRQTAAMYLELPHAQGGVGLPNLQAVLDDCTASKVLRWSLRPHSAISVGGHAQLQNAQSSRIHCLPLGTSTVKGTTSWHHGYNTLQQRLQQATPSTTGFTDKYAQPLQGLQWYWSSASRCHWETPNTTGWIDQCTQDNPLSAEQQHFLQHVTFQMLKLPYPTAHSFQSTIRDQGSTTPTSGWFECQMHGTQSSTVINLVAGLRLGIIKLRQNQFSLFQLPHPNVEWRWTNNLLQGIVEGKLQYQASRFRTARPIRIQDTTTDSWHLHWPRQSPLLQRICIPEAIARKIQEPGLRIKRAQHPLELLARTKRREKALLGRARTNNRHQVMLQELNINTVTPKLPNLWHKAPGTSHLVWFAFRYHTLRLNTYVKGPKDCKEGCGATNTLPHTLWSCPHAQRIWANSLSHWRGMQSKPKHWKNAILGSSAIPPPKQAYDFPQFLTLQRRHPELVHNIIQQGWRLVVLLTLHYLWTRFNKHRYPDTILTADLQRHIASTFECLSRYHAQSKRFISSAVLTLLARCYNDPSIVPALPRLHAQVKFDGASQGNPGPGGCGAVLLVRQQGRLRPTAFTARHIADNKNTNNAAEYRALLDGLELAAAHGISHLHIVGDSELVVNQTNGTAKVNSSLRQMAHKVQQWLTRFQKVTVRNVRREHNQAADFLSKQRQQGEVPLINQPVAGWEAEATLLHFLKVEHHNPP